MAFPLSRSSSRSLPWSLWITKPTRRSRPQRERWDSTWSAGKNNSNSKIGARRRSIITGVPATGCTTVRAERRVRSHARHTMEKGVLTIIPTVRTHVCCRRGRKTRWIYPPPPPEKAQKGKRETLVSWSVSVHVYDQSSVFLYNAHQRWARGRGPGGGQPFFAGGGGVQRGDFWPPSAACGRHRGGGMLTPWARLTPPMPMYAAQVYKIFDCILTCRHRVPIRQWARLLRHLPRPLPAQRGLPPPPLRRQLRLGNQQQGHLTAQARSHPLQNQHLHRVRVPLLPQRADRAKHLRAHQHLQRGT